MKPFKQNKPGMSLIEVVAAIAIFAIFGTSLFLMQQFLFDRMMNTQRMLLATVRMQTELVDYQTAILKELFEQNGPIEKSLQQQVKDFTHPDMTIKVTTKTNLAASAAGKDSPLKDFKNLYLICVSAEQDKREYAKSYIFSYIPEVAKQ